MASIKINGREVSVLGDRAEEVVAAPKFLKWVAGLDPRFVVKSVKVLATMFTKNGLLFAFLDCDVTDQSGNKVPGAVFLRGGAVAVLVVLKDKLLRLGQRTYDKYFVLTVQPRFPVGTFEAVECVAGMVDENTKNVVGVAVKELQEETGIDRISISDLIPLGSIFSTMGGCDEEVALFAFEAEWPLERIQALQAKLTGEGPHEKIKLVVVPEEELLHMARKDPKAVIAYFKYNLYMSTLSGGMPW